MDNVNISQRVFDQYLDEEIYNEWIRGKFQNIDDMLNALSYNNGRVLIEAKDDMIVASAAPLHGKVFAVAAIQWLHDISNLSVDQTKSIIENIRIELVEKQIAPHSLIEDFEQQDGYIDHVRSSLGNLSLEGRMLLSKIYKNVRTRAKANLK